MKVYLLTEKYDVDIDTLREGYSVLYTSPVEIEKCSLADGPAKVRAVAKDTSVLAVWVDSDYLRQAGGRIRLEGKIKEYRQSSEIYNSLLSEYNNSGIQPPSGLASLFGVVSSPSSGSSVGGTSSLFGGVSGVSGLSGASGRGISVPPSSASSLSSSEMIGAGEGQFSEEESVRREELTPPAFLDTPGSEGTLLRPTFLPQEKEEAPVASPPNDSYKEKYLALQAENQRLEFEIRNKDAQLQEFSALGLVEDNSSEVANLQSELASFKEELFNSQKRNQSLEKENQLVSKQLQDIQKESSLKDSKIQELNAQVVTANSRVPEGYVSLTELQSSQKLVDALSAEVKDLREYKNTTQSKINSIANEEGNYKSRISSLEQALSDANDTVTRLDDELSTANADKINAINALNAYKESNMVDEDSLREMNNLRTRVAELELDRQEHENNVFTRMGIRAEENQRMAIRLYAPDDMQNISFCYAGSTESRRGVYKALYDRTVNSEQGEYLIVDLVSETAIDYVFQLRQLVNAGKWFSEGGELAPYLTNTKWDFVKVLSLGVRYINDAYFLCLDWERILSDLNNSGYRVFIFCGDLSNVVGRILYDTFLTSSQSFIFTKGVPTSVRTLITNLRGLSKGGESNLVFYDQYFSKLTPDYNCLEMVEGRFEPLQI